MVEFVLWGGKMKKNKTYDFDFNHIDEIKIYRYAVEADSRKRKKIRNISEKYNTYKDWKEYHVIKKYKHITYKSLCDLRKFLYRRLENELDKDNSTSGFFYPIIISLITMVAAFVTKEYKSSDLKMIVTLGYIIFFAFYILKYEMFDNIALKNLYRDYVEIIDEMIEEKSPRIKICYPHECAKY